MKAFNINSCVKVKLNERGIEILKNAHEELKEKVPSIGEFELPEIDEKGYSEFQLWKFMNKFGPYMGAGIEPPFDTNIVIEDKLLNDQPEIMQRGMHR